MLPVILSSLSACFKCFSHSLPDPITEPTDSNTDKKRCGQLASLPEHLSSSEYFGKQHIVPLLSFSSWRCLTQKHTPSSKPYFLQSVLLIREIFPQQLTGLSKQFSVVRKLRGHLTQNIFKQSYQFASCQPYFFFHHPFKHRHSGGCQKRRENCLILGRKRWR